MREEMRGTSTDPGESFNLLDVVLQDGRLLARVEAIKLRYVINLDIVSDTISETKHIVLAGKNDFVN